MPALAQVLDAPERGDHLLADLRAFTAAFDDLEIGATAGSSEYMAEPVPSQHMISAYGTIQALCNTTWHYTFEKSSIRILQYQRLTAHTHAATVEDQLSVVSLPLVWSETERLTRPHQCLRFFRGQRARQRRLWSIYRLEDQLDDLIPTNRPGFPENAKYVKLPYFVAPIAYSGGASGLLIYVKLSMAEKLSFVARGYKAQNPRFSTPIDFQPIFCSRAS